MDSSNSYSVCCRNSYYWNINIGTTSSCRTSAGPPAGPPAGPVATDINCTTPCVDEAELTFDTATQAELDAKSVDDADADPTNELQDWNNLPAIPAGFADGVDNVNDADADPTNELNTSFSLSGTILTLIDAGGALAVDLSSLVGAATNLICGTPCVDEAELTFNPATQTELNTHVAVSSAHHARYTNAEAVTAVGPHYTDAEAVSAIEAATLTSLTTSGDYTYSSSQSRKMMISPLGFTPRITTELEPLNGGAIFFVPIAPALGTSTATYALTGLPDGAVVTKFICAFIDQSTTSDATFVCSLNSNLPAGTPSNSIQLASNQLTTSGSSTSKQFVTDSTINSPTIDTDNKFYWVKLDMIPDGTDCAGQCQFYEVIIEYDVSKAD